MKKYIVLALCVLLLIAAAVPVMAAEETIITVTPSRTLAERGETVDFTVSISGDVPFTSVMVGLNFDSRYFEYVSSQNASVNGMLIPYSPSEPEVGLLMMGGGTYTGTLQVITFKVKNDAPLEKVTVTGDPKGSDANGSITVKFQGASVSINCEHTYGDWTKLDDDKHQRICSKCQTPQTEDHDWNDGVGKPAPTCTAPGTIEYTCLICQTTKTENAGERGHAWDNNCDTTCNRGCGTVRPATHSYGATWSSDTTGHWRECSSCGDKKDVAAHTPGPEATEKAAQTCTVCNFEIKAALAHTHVLEKEWTTDSNYHWHRCETRNPSCYYVADKAKHDYDDDCDVTCNTCAYIREAPHKYKPEWQANGEGHWNVCSACNAKSQVFDHIPGPEATMDTPQTCEECNYIIKMQLSHVHDYGDVWYNDDESHWQSCVDCTESTTMEPHDWDEGVELEDGKMEYTCAVCTKQIVTDGPMESQSNTVPSTQLPSTQKPTEPGGSGRFPWQWAGIAAIVLLVIGVVLLVIEFIRSRKTNRHGKFSK